MRTPKPRHFYGGEGGVAEQIRIGFDDVDLPKQAYIAGSKTMLQA